MHGELIEFNERLYRSLMAKDNLIGQMRQELIDLRGPVSTCKHTQAHTHTRLSVGVGNRTFIEWLFFLLYLCSPGTLGRSLSASIGLPPLPSLTVCLCQYTITFLCLKHICLAN